MKQPIKLLMNIANAIPEDTRGYEHKNTECAVVWKQDEGIANLHKLDVKITLHTVIHMHSWHANMTKYTCDTIKYRTYGIFKGTRRLALPHTIVK